MPRHVLPFACGVALLAQACTTLPPERVPAPLGETQLKPLTASLLQLGDEAQGRNDYAAAAGFYRRARDEEPDQRTVVTRLGSALIGLHAYAQALALYRQAQTTMPNDPEIAFRLGELYLKTGDVLGALDQLETARKLKDDDPRIYNAIGVAYSMKHRYDLAQKYYAAGLRIAPGQARLLNNLALAQYLAGDDAKAKETLKALAALPDQQPQAAALRAALSGGRTGERDVVLGVNLASAADTPEPAPAALAETPAPAAAHAPAKTALPDPPHAPPPAPAAAAAPPAARLAALAAPLQATLAHANGVPAAAAALPAEPPDAATLAPALNAIRPTEAPAPSPPRQTQAAPAALPVVPVEVARLAPVPDAIRPAEAPAPAAPARVRAAPDTPVAYQPPAPARYFYCVRSAAPVDRDAAEAQKRIAHASLAVAPLIYTLHGEATPDAADALHFTVQFGAFASEPNARRLIERLQASGVAAKLVLLPRAERAEHAPSPQRERHTAPEKLSL
ncbi:MAG TPA: tetratricopeptide repeat protein [Stellaceae bacterium]|nr:tetratricopeptide repeat protein [Stellaceae bacterium]